MKKYLIAFSVLMYSFAASAETIIVVDGNGNIVAKHSGYTDGAENELIDEVRKLLAN